MYTEQLSQGLSIAAAINPQTINNSSANSGAGVDMSKFKRVLAVVSIGSNSGSVVAKLQGATTSGGSFNDITGASATAVTAANKVLTIEYRADEATDTNRFVKLVLTEGNSANAVVSAVILGGESLQKPANQYDIAAVTQRLVA
jgi:hypothetical protein